MKKISELIEKFKTVGLKEHQIKDELIKILKEDFKVEVERKHLEIKEKILTLRISGPQKTEIILHRNKIIEKLKERGFEIWDIN
jgi:hypothetical protein